MAVSNEHANIMERLQIEGEESAAWGEFVFIRLAEFLGMRVVSGSWAVFVLYF